MTLNDYLRENQIHGAGCHESVPKIIATSTPWGTIGVILKCKSCGNTVASPGDNIIEAFNRAFTDWNNRQRGGA